MSLERTGRGGGRGIRAWLRYGLYILVFGCIFLALGAEEPYQGLLGAVVCLWAGNMLYALERLRERILFFWLHITLFTFLIGRPVITALRGQQWWDYGHDNVLFALISLLLTQIFLVLGAFLGQQRALRLRGRGQEALELRGPQEALELRRLRGGPQGPLKLQGSRLGALRRQRTAEGAAWQERGFARAFRYYLGYVSQIVFYSSLVFTFMLGREKIVYIADHTYYEYFAKFKSQLPYIVYELSTLTRYSLCFFLAGLPKKRRAFPALSLYVLAAVPELIVGERNPIVLRTIFALSYYVLRDLYRESDPPGRGSGSRPEPVSSPSGRGARARSQPDRSQTAARSQPDRGSGRAALDREGRPGPGGPPWIGRLEKAALLAGIPCGLVFLGMMNYVREGGGGTRLGFFGAIVDLFYKQGVSFQWLALGHGVIADLPGKGRSHYTFGSFIDYFAHGSVAQRFFGAVPLGSNNSLAKATLGHSLAHHMSYMLMGPEEYLAGHGCGSSYLLELFIDYGYLGICVFSLGLGYLLLLGPELARRRPFFLTLLLLCMTNLFLIPRAEAMGFLSFVLTMQFWAAAAICCGGALLLSRRFYPRKGRL